VLPSTADTFLTIANIRNILAGQAIVAVVALALMLPLVAGEFDISVGAVLGAACYLGADLMTDSGVPVLLALAGGVALGAVVGMINGWVVAYIRANAIVITLGVAILLGGLVALYSDNKSIVGIPTSVVDFGSGLTLGIPNTVWVMLVVAVFLAYILRYTVYGRTLLFVGSNPRAARLVGVRSKRLVFSTFVIAGTLSGLAGGLLLAQTGAANPQVGFDYTLAAFVAPFLGAATIRPGQFNVPGTIVAVYFVAISVNGLTLAGAADWVEPVFNGTAVIIAVSVSTTLARRRGTIQLDA
jgi:ribose transport system permease protein